MIYFQFQEDFRSNKILSSLRSTFDFFTSQTSFFPLGNFDIGIFCQTLNLNKLSITKVYLLTEKCGLKCFYSNLNYIDPLFSHWYIYIFDISLSFSSICTFCISLYILVGIGVKWPMLGKLFGQIWLPKRYHSNRKKSWRKK